MKLSSKIWKKWKPDLTSSLILNADSSLLSLMVASPPLQRTLGIVTVEQNRVSAKARTGSEKQVYRLGLIAEEKSKRKKGKEREIRLRHHRKGRPELGFQVEGGGFWVYGRERTTLRKTVIGFTAFTLLMIPTLLYFYRIQTVFCYYSFFCNWIYYLFGSKLFQFTKTW